MARYRYLFMYSGGCFFELAKFTVGIVVLAILIHYFVFTIIPISGESMYPNFHDRDWAAIDKFTYLTSMPQRGDVVAVRFPGDPDNEKYIKRIIGLPGETIAVKEGIVYINEKKLPEIYLPEGIITQPEGSITLQDDEYYLIGDNRLNSSDSRKWGSVTAKEIIGKARFIVFPLSRYQSIYTPTYPM